MERDVFFFVVPSPVQKKNTGNAPMVDIGNFHIGTIEMGCLISLI
jgi:hypothetical protein